MFFCDLILRNTSIDENVIVIKKSKLKEKNALNFNNLNNLIFSHNNQFIVSFFLFKEQVRVFRNLFKGSNKLDCIFTIMHNKKKLSRSQIQRTVMLKCRINKWSIRAANESSLY